ncbi:MAG: hypothetical protein AAF711_00540 [Planctomycetota bacterium]
MPELLDLQTIQHVADADTLRANRRALSPKTEADLVEAFRELGLGSALALTPTTDLYIDEVYEAVERALTLIEWKYLRSGVSLTELVGLGVRRSRERLSNQARELLRPVAQELGCKLAVRQLADGRVGVIKLHKSMPANAVTVSGTGVGC